VSEIGYWVKKLVICSHDFQDFILKRQEFVKSTSGIVKAEVKQIIFLGRNSYEDEFR
jgi:hypothetical protein